MREKFITVTCLTHKFDRGNGLVVGLIIGQKCILTWHQMGIIWAIVYG